MSRSRWRGAGPEPGPEPLHPTHGVAPARRDVFAGLREAARRQLHRLPGLVVANGVGEPVETFVQSVSCRGASGLDV